MNKNNSLHGSRRGTTVYKNLMLVTFVKNKKEKFYVVMRRVVGIRWKKGGDGSRGLADEYDCRGRQGRRG